jgi:hypothetical protein
MSVCVPEMRSHKDRPRFKLPYREDVDTERMLSHVKRQCPSTFIT